jgi:hypothetical protein
MVSEILRIYRADQYTSEWASSLNEGGDRMPLDIDYKVFAKVPLNPLIHLISGRSGVYFYTAPADLMHAAFMTEKKRGRLQSS